MINQTYMFLIGRLNRGLLIFSGLFIGLIQFLIIWIFTSFDYAPILEAILEQLPPQMKILFSEQFLIQLSVSGAAAFGFNHPLVLFNLGILAIALPGWHIAGEAESGILELHLAYPIRRETLFTSLWLTCAASLLTVILCGYFGSLTALMIKSQFEWSLALSLLKVIFNLWLLFTFIMSFALWISTKNRESGKSGSIASSIALLFYFLFFLGSTWQLPKYVQLLNPFFYYQPSKLMFNQASFTLNLIVLSIVILVMFVSGYHQFKRRDIP